MFRLLVLSKEVSERMLWERGFFVGGGKSGVWMDRASIEFVTGRCFEF